MGQKWRKPQRDHYNATIEAKRAKREARKARAKRRKKPQAGLLTKVAGQDINWSAMPKQMLTKLAESRAIGAIAESHAILQKAEEQMTHDDAEMLLDNAWKHLTFTSKLAIIKGFLTNSLR